ncbi:ABC transporter, ATP-binding protein [Methylophaga frappieri]|uniref:ABC transporter, ATP-binding protein n=1 Tax=Methylophaga frappieri (strain ATCC BAA-2434 / DSM 25690 / JAM7) TaxID=754477 RepID=I1YL75_METFJ|nr:ABC transporter ATP-binding protein [Methylophaga frappieri]AFJ03668.1 ABC transporter, ATP-binding protein [Methylophaga frappieri]
MSQHRPTINANDCIIKIDQLNHQVFPGGKALPILHDVNLQIQRGESVAIVGRSGSGKTTLLGLMAGLDVPTSGEINLDGQPISQLSEDARAQLRASKVGFVFQSFQLLPALTALENVLLPLELAGHASPRGKATQLLSQVGLADRLGHTPRQLSGGEQQRVAIARAFAVDPVILFADEPTGNLDSETGATITDILMQMNQQQNTTLVMVTHDSQLARRCDRQFQIDAGRITQS